MEREPRQSRTVEVTITAPINIEDIMKTERGCFGYLWDLRTSECSKCADRDVCGIVFNDKVVKPQTEAIQEDQGALFLDLTDFKNVTEKRVFSFVKSGETKVSDLLSHVMALAHTSDRKAGVEFLKRFIKSNENISTKEGIVWTT